MERKRWILPGVLAAALWMVACDRDGDTGTTTSAPGKEGMVARHHDHVDHEHHTEDDSHADHEHHGDHAHHHETLAAEEPLDDYSVFHLTSTWSNQDGEEFQWESLRGSPSVVVMFFATCDTACPLLVRDVKRLKESLSPELAEDLQVVFVTFDSERDTPERLREYGEERGIDFTRWSLLHGADGQIRELAAVLGVRYRQVGDGDFMHSNVITVLDEEGRILHRTEGLGQPIKEAVRSLSERSGR